MTILNRRPKSGFVLYPKQVEKRVVDGTARFRTRCDVLVGPCACGGVHQEDDPWVQHLLQHGNFSIEPLVLHPQNGSVKIPRYWVKPRFHQSCTVLQGPCSCGATHIVGERWVQDLLMAHYAIIEGHAIIDTEPCVIEDHVEGAFSDCNCDSCRNRIEEHRQVLDRRSI